MLLRVQFLFVTFFCLSSSVVSAQHLPVNFPLYDEYLRRLQILGQIDNEFSFNYKSINIESAFPEFSNIYALEIEEKENFSFQKNLEAKKLKISPLPLQVTTVFNSHNPYGWGNGAIKPSRGLQTLIAAGTHLSYGKFSLQLYPHFHFNQNRIFEEYPQDASDAYYNIKRRDYRGVDQPTRNGQSSYIDFLPGNSHLMFNFGSFAAGASTENIWWGPGKTNALLLSDNAPGFLHATLRTTKPAKTFLGNFEGQYFIGKLDGSNQPTYSDSHQQSTFHDREDIWRYFTGISASYSPKWVKGLSIGFSRTFQINREDMEDNFRAFVPLFDPLPKDALGNDVNNEMGQDQHVSAFARWYIPKAQFEFYVEFMRNDHSINWRDLLVSPEHSRGYILGFSKYLQLEKNQLLEISGEMVQTSNPINRMVRYGGIDRGVSIYYNNQVSHGLTHRGQILGSGLGLSGNLQKISLNKINKMEKVGIFAERLERDAHFYQKASEQGIPVRPWIDLVLGGVVNKQYKSLLISGTVRSIFSHNRNWWIGPENAAQDFYVEKVEFNLNAEINAAYFF